MLQCYSIRDTKVGTYMSPFFVPTETHAMRSIQIALQQSQSNLAQFPGDFDLFLLGTLNEESGEISPLMNPQHIISISTLINNNKEKNNVK